MDLSRELHFMILEHAGNSELGLFQVIFRRGQDGQDLQDASLSLQVSVADYPRHLLLMNVSDLVLFSRVRKRICSFSKRCNELLLQIIKKCAVSFQLEDLPHDCKALLVSMQALVDLLKRSVFFWTVTSEILK